ncbi:MAG: thymidylate synthase [Dehalococcoidia bacterium]|nr:thymidylate synthase [Dehalococcoidia bacterium]
MEITFIKARDLPEAWFRCLRSTLEKGREYVIDRGSWVGHKRKELDMAVIQVERPSMRPLIPDVKPGIPPPTSMDYIEDYMSYLMTSLRADNEQYTYGEDLEIQIPEVIKMYREQGHNTNQGYMTVGKPQSIFLEDPPCLRGIDTRIRDGKLNFIMYFRSWDLWAGFPSNLGGIQLLKEFMACEIGVEDGEIIVSSKGLHLYDYCWDIARAAAGIEGLQGNLV